MQKKTEIQRNEIEISKTKKMIEKLKLFWWRVDDQVYHTHLIYLFFNYYFQYLQCYCHQIAAVKTASTLQMNCIYLSSAMHESHTPFESFQFRYEIIKQWKCIMGLGYNTRVGEKHDIYWLLSQIVN